MIRILDKEVASKIAAGETVERPASVVKELIENSLDAGAWSIDVRLDAGGNIRIEVSDDGQGMSYEDLALSCERHATSKIVSVADLRQVRTLGFRGEAMAALKVAADLKIITKEPTEKHGWSLETLNGVTQLIKPAARVGGTTVIVEELFKRMPARKSALKEPAVEAAAIMRVVREAACARPDVRFSVRTAKKVLLDVKPSDWLERVRNLWEIPEGVLKPFDIQLEGGQIEGLVWDPKDRTSRGQRSVFLVNGRVVENPEFKKAVQAGVAGRGHTVDAWVRFALPPMAIDVNITPTKTLVGLRGRTEEINALKEAIKALATPNFAEVTQKSALGRRQLSLPAETEGVGPVDNTFLVISDQDGILYIDQHAASERVLYEKIRHFASDGGQVKLGKPVQIGFPTVDPSVLEARLGAAQKAGFDLRTEGRNLKLYQVPAWPWQGSFESLAIDLFKVLGEEEEIGSGRTVELLWDRLLKRLACQGALKAHTPLTLTERQALWSSVRALDLGLSDIHGRPGGIWLSSQEMRRAVGR